MIRDREDPFAITAGALSLLVHGVLLALLMVSFSWHNVAKPLQVAQVELWDSLPTPKVALPPPEPPKPEPKVELPPAPEPPAPPPEPKVEIQIKAKPPVESKPKPEKKPEPKQKATPKPEPALKTKEDLKRLQQLMNEEDQQLQQDVQQKDAQQVADARQAAAAQAASSGAVNDAMSKIRNKIYRYVNRQVCGSGKPVLEFAIALMPTGEVSGSPRLIRSSGIAACDQAIERAILQAQPLPLPPQPELFAQFRDLTLRFRPNEE